MKTVQLNNGLEMTIYRPTGKEAAEVLDYTKKIGAESNNLLMGAEGAPYTVEQEAEFLNEQSRQPSSAFFAARISGKIVATANIANPSAKRINHTAELAVAVRKKHWGQGVGSAMMRTLIEFAQETGNIKLLHLGVKQDNIAAQKLYTKIGFVECGRMPDFFCVDGSYYDEILMCLKL